MLFVKTNALRSFIGRLEAGDDLLTEITAFCVSNNVRFGTVQVIGAVRKAAVGYYDQGQKRYTGCVTLDKKLEIASCSGNISLKDNEIFVHLHVVFADHEAHTYGGHLMPGTTVFAAEFFIEELAGDPLARTPEPVTGLPLWSKP